MTERDFQKLVLVDLRANDFLVAHFGSSVKIVRRPGGEYATIPDLDARGFPDVVALRDDVGLALELKGEKTRVRPEQLIWIAAFRDAGFMARIVRPVDWADLRKEIGMSKWGGWINV